MATDHCVVLSGRLVDPYTSTTIDYVRGGGAGVDIDHVVALSDAWQKGAQRWPARERVAFANDPLNLLAVDASANRQKGDGDTATWLPANKPFRCTYVARQVSVKLKYAVSVTKAERDAMLRVLGTCPSKRVTVAARRRTGSSAARVFANCAAARAAGVAPIRRGTPLYAANQRLDAQQGRRRVPVTALQALLEPVVRVGLVVERLDLDVPGRAVEADRLAQRPVGLEAHDADAAVARPLARARSGCAGRPRGREPSRRPTCA